MKIYLDSGNLEEIKELSYFLDGVTTNPSILHLNGGNISDIITEMAKFIRDSLSVEVISTNYDEMLSEALKLAKINPKVVVKLPMTLNGIKVCRMLNQQNIRTNVTLCFSIAQALLAAKAGATYVSPFVGRLNDVKKDGIQLIHNIRKVFDNYNYSTKILAASIRSVSDLELCAVAGADVVTSSYHVIKEMFHHELTDVGLERFINDAKISGYKI